MTLGLGPGDTLGAYRVVRVLGRGGMGVVLEAHDTGLRRQVALKVIAPHLAEDPVFRARFAREARALAALDSAHVVRVYAYGEEAGRLYLATQLVPDGDLEALLQESGALPLPAALGLAAQVADGLDDAHAAGLVHRDIKPANVLLRRRGGLLHAYLSDFGVVRRVGIDHTREPGSGTIGTPSYMAPELHTGGEAGVASDVYALGCLVWAALTGRAPYVGTSDFEVVTAHRERPVPQLAGDEPMVAAVNAVLRRALAKDPALRYPRAAAMRDDLRAAASLAAPAGPVGPASAPDVGRRPSPRTALLAGAAALLVLVVGGVAAAVLGGKDPSPPGWSAEPSSTGTPTPSSPGTSTGTTAGTTRGTTTGTTPAGAVDKATTSLAEALEAQGVLTRSQAACAAGRWIQGAGLQEMADLGFFDERWAYVDQDRSVMTPEMDAAATTAVLRCAAPG